MFKHGSMNQPQPEYRAGQKSKPRGYHVGTLEHAWFQMIHLRSGSLCLFGAEGDRMLGRDDVLLLPEGSIWEYKCRSEGYTGLFYFACGDPDPLLRGQVSVVRADGGMKMLADMMEHELQNPASGTPQIVLGLARALAYRALALDQKRPSPRDGERYVRYWADCARAALDSTQGTGVGVREALAPLRLSYRQLCRYFRQAYGTMPKAYQLDMRVEEAKRRLLTTQATIAEIANEVGYATQQHLCGHFRARVGCSPKLYRKNGPGARPQRANS
ncbi:MAG: helix-turn-helix transcriptional regulator [Kiritimatiellae bacterium]|nr:helix-turn-helix transcriptional regulator [Kiritimatiellia bacterium]